MHFHLNSLIGKKSPRALRKELEQLPFGSGTYDLAYQKVMERIHSQSTDQKALAVQALTWTTCAPRPLSPLELWHALSVELDDARFDEDNLPDLEDIVSVCAGLITVTGDSVQLVHYTAQQYLECTLSSWSPTAHRDIGRICVTYLLFDEFREGFCQTHKSYLSRLQQYPLHQYASQKWGYHCGIQPGDEQLVLRLLRNGPKTEACAQALLAGSKFSWFTGNSIRVPKMMTSVHLAAYFGLSKALEQLAEADGLHDHPDFFGRTPLSWAAKNGHEAVLGFLLGRGAVLEVKDKYSQTALSRASEYGREGAVQLLLSYGADAESRDNYGQTPLSRAAENGHGSVVTLLLNHGANSESKDDIGQTPLVRAVQNGQENMVKLLLDNGTNPNSADIYGQTALSRAAWRCHQGVIVHLLSHGADILARAVQTSREETAKLLLDKGADPNASDNYSQTPLLRAIWMSHQRMIEYLLEKGADLEARQKSGRTALTNAAINGQCATLKFLLDKGANPHVRDQYGTTPLAWAAVSGHDAVVKVLLSAGVDPNSRDRFGRTPLLGAAAAGQVAVVQALLGHAGVDPEARDLYGRNALAEARQRGHVDVARLLSSVEQCPVTAAEQPLESRYICDICRVNIGPKRYHCDICDEGDFDICHFCIESGAYCLDSKHTLSV